MPYVYEFVVWPEEHHPRWTAAVYRLFDLIKGRVAMDFTGRACYDFREELSRAGLSLQEISRTPHHTPEPVL